jgi:DNA-binding MarR family transcriptional regulator
MPLLETSDLNVAVSSDDPDVRALNDALLRMARAILLRNDTTSPLVDLPIAQIRCLNAVAKEEGRKMLDLAQDMDIKLPALSQIVERLVQRGMVERRADPQDRRVARIHLTSSARSAISRMRALRENRLKSALEQLSGAEIEAALAALNKLAEASEQAQKQEGLHCNVASVPLDGADPMVEMLARRARTRRPAALAGLTKSVGA